MAPDFSRRMLEGKLIGPVPTTPAEALANWRSVRERVHVEFDKASTEQRRVALLELYCSSMNLAEKAIGSDELEKFREIRGHGYALLIVKECLVGDRVSLEQAEAVTQREMVAGRMAADHVLRNRGELAKLAAQYVQTRQLVHQHATESTGLLRRVLSWLHG